jgi:protein phosphatase 1 regulatory subunit 37
MHFLFVFQTSAEHLETLNLGHNPITNEGIHILKDGLLKSKGLLKLGLSGTKVSCEGNNNCCSLC